ncbi:MAG TPA: chaplin family protein, partial [Streptosporangiaceae bacterium]|nr:chaplin family protein [Streptosporangiaceae bacterium]
APIDACGNAIAIFGSAEAGCKGGASVTNDSHSRTGRTDGTSSVLGGNQAYAPISAPVDVCGNAAGTFGDAVAGCAGGAKVHNGSGPGSMHTTGKGSVGGGNQAYAPVSAPIDVCGNGATASCDGGASVHNAGTPPMNTVGGSQVYAPVGAPVVVCGNAVVVHGQAEAGCAGGSTVATNPGDPTTSGKEGVLSGNQAYAPITAPVNVCGNAVAVAGDASAGCVGTAHAASSSAGNVVTSGEHGIGAGNQVIAPVKAPVEVCGNSVAVAGSADPECGIGSGGGVMMTDRNAQRAGAPAALGIPVLPMVPGLVKALPVTAGALPQLPVALPVAQSAPADNSLPGLPSLPVSGLPVGGLPVGGLPQLPAGLQQLPAESGLPQLPAGLQQLPVGGLLNGSPLRTAQSATPAPFPAPVSMLPDLFGGLPGSLPGGLVPGGLSPAGVIPNGLVPAGLVPAMPQMPVHQAAPAPLLPGLPQIPLVGDGTAGIVGGHLNPPQLGSVRDTLNSVRLSADSTPVNSGYALALGALLAGASMLLTLGRRFRRR